MSTRPAPVSAPATAEIEVHVPTLLRDCVGDRSSVAVPGATLREGLRNLLERYPLLRVHLYDERGERRRHVLLYYNGESIDHVASLDAPLRPGDQLEVVQAVSGG